MTTPNLEAMKIDAIELLKEQTLDESSTTGRAALWLADGGIFIWIAERLVAPIVVGILSKKIYEKYLIPATKSEVNELERQVADIHEKVDRGVSQERLLGDVTNILVEEGFESSQASKIAPLLIQKIEERLTTNC